MKIKDIRTQLDFAEGNYCDFQKKGFLNLCFGDNVRFIKSSEVYKDDDNQYPDCSARYFVEAELDDAANLVYLLRDLDGVLINGASYGDELPDNVVCLEVLFMKPTGLSYR